MKLSHKGTSYVIFRDMDGPIDCCTGKVSQKEKNIIYECIYVESKKNDTDESRNKDKDKDLHIWWSPVKAHVKNQ